MLVAMPDHCNQMLEESMPYKRPLEAVAAFDAIQAIE